MSVSSSSPFGSPSLDYSSQLALQQQQYRQQNPSAPPMMNQWSGGQPPFSSGQSPFSSGQSPFSSGQSPFTGGQSPFTGGQSPFTGGQPPFSSSQSPFTGGQSPFTGGQSPFSSGQSPFSSGQSPFSSTPTLYTSPYGPPMSPIPQHFYSAKTKLIAWSLLQPLLSILERDTSLPAPGENPLQPRAAGPERYILAISAMAEQVQRYARRTGPDNESFYVSTRVVTPVLEEYHRHFHEYGTKLPTPPNYAMIQLDTVLGKNIYQFQAFASGVFDFFFPSCFTYNNVQLQILGEMGHAALKVILSKLFARDPRGGPEHRKLFEKIFENADLLRKARYSDFVEDRNKDHGFIEISTISNMLMDVLRNAAIASLNYLAQIFPSLITNPLYKDQVERLHFMSTAY